MRVTRRNRKAKQRPDEARRDLKAAIAAYGDRADVTGEQSGDGGGAARVGSEERAAESEPVPARYLQDSDNASSSAGTPRLGSQERGWAQPGAAIHQSESAAFAAHLDAQPRVARRVAAEPDGLDPAVERARIERELGVPELAASLAQYGTPPIAPPAKHTDRDALEREALAAAEPAYSRWNFRARRSLRNQLRKQAARQAQAEDERLAAEQRLLQAELDNRWARLRALRHQAARDADAWVEKEMTRRKATRGEQQAILDRESRHLRDADASSVSARLRTALPDQATKPLGFLEGVAVLLITCPDREALIAETEPAFTGARQRAVRTRSAKRRNDLYLAAIASRILAGVGRALSTTQAVEAVTGVAVRACDSSPRRWEPIYVGTFERDYAERVVTEGRWSPDADVLAAVIEGAGEVELDRNDITHEIAALDLSDDPGLAAVVDRVDPVAGSDENAARSSDQEAVKALLGYADIGRDGADTGHHGDAGSEEEQMADLQPDRDAATAVPEPQGVTVPQDSETEALESPEMSATETTEMTVPETPQMTPTEPGESAVAETSDTAAYEPAPGAQSTLEDLTHRGAEDDLAGGRGGAASGPVGDPLAMALKDSDGSVRRAAVEAIGRRNDSSDTPLLLQALSDPDDIVRLEAMYALKDRLSPDMRRDALVRASGDRDEIVRRKAIEALADLADERDTPVLLEALKDPDDRVRLEAVYAVRNRLAPGMRDALIDACGDIDAGVRRKAVEALAELGDERDAPLLLGALKDPDSSVRLEAIYALEGRSTLGPSSGLSEPLMEAMRSDDAIVRQAAVRLFGRLDEPGSPTPPS